MVETRSLEWIHLVKLIINMNIRGSYQRVLVTCSSETVLCGADHQQVVLCEGAEVEAEVVERHEDHVGTDSLLGGTFLLSHRDSAGFFECSCRVVEDVLACEADQILLVLTQTHLVDLLSLLSRVLTAFEVEIK